MILTSDHKTVVSSFDTPVNFQVIAEYGDQDSGEAYYGFQVGPLQYRMGVHYSQLAGGWDVSFGLQDVVGSTEELQEYFSRVFKRPVELHEVETLRERFLSHKYSNLKVADSKGVFSGVVAVLRHVMKKYDPKCIIFSVFQEDKSRVYQALIRKFLKGWVAEPNNRGYGFNVCKPDEEQNLDTDS